MKGKRLLVVLLALVLAFTSFTACGLFGKDKDKDTEKGDGGKTEAVTLTDKALAGDMLIDFTKGADPSVVFESDGWTNGDVFNVVWAKNNVKYENGKMTLNIVKEDKNAWVNDQEVTYPYTAGEARTQNYFGYGDYTVKMKPSANMGTASTFFICTGNYDSKYVLDENGNVVYNEDGTIKSEPNRHDEIDIEFLGKDTTKVQFNFFVNGKGGNEYMYDLGFDASKEYHEYGFRWEEDSITWFVDGKPVYKVTTDKTATAAANVRIVEEIPYTPGRILMSHWCGNEGAYGWMGEYAGNTKDNGCEYEWVKSTTKGAPLNPEITTPGGETVEVPEIDWSAITAINPTFDSTEVYTVANKGTTSNIKYSAVGGSTYINVEMDIAAAAKQKNVLHLTLKNNANKDVQVRVNVVDAELLAKGAQNSSTNKKATANGVEVRTDLEWGGSFIDIPAGETADVVISFTGAVEKLQLMIDSSRNDAETRAGDVTVSDIKFVKDGEIVDENTVGEYKINPFDKIMKATVAVNVRDLPHKDGNKLGTLAKGEVVLVTGQCEQTKWYRIAYKDGKVGYVTPEYLTAAAAGEYPAPSASNAIYINGKEYFFEKNDYTLKSDKNNNLNVTYKDIVGATYKNISAYVSGISADYNKLTLKVKNNGSEAMKLRIDVNGATPMCKNPDGGDMNASNLYATQDGNEVYTDLQWGGSQFTIEAGKTSTLEIYFDATKNVETLIMFIDSSDYLEDGKNVKHSGNITISGVTFSKGTIPSKEEEPEQGGNDDNQGGNEGGTTTPPAGETTTVEADLTFNSDTYTVEKDAANKTWHVTYANVGGADYAVISAAIESIDAGLNKFTVKVKNNGTTEAKVRIDILGKDATNANTYACNVSATQDGNKANTDLEWGGSTFTIPAGKTSVLEVTFNASKQAVTVNMFFDSHTWGDTGVYSGDVTLSDMAFIGVLEGENNGPIVSPAPEGGNEGGNEGEGGEGGNEDSDDENTTPEVVYATISGEKIKVDGDTDVYAVTEDEEDVNIKYSGVAGDSWSNLCLWVKEVAAENNTFHIEITNNGEATVKIRIDLKDEDDKLTNLSALMTAVEVSSTAHDSTYVEIEAGSTAIVEITYDTEMETALLYFFIDSWVQDGETHAGDITVAGMEFKTEVPDVETEELKFWIGEGSDASAEGSNGIGYTVDPKDTAAKEVNITYTGKDQDFKTIGSWVKELFAEKDTFVFDITNNDTEHNVKVRFDVKDAAGVINVAVTAENGTVSQNGTENYVEVEAGETATVTVKFEGAVQELIMFVGCCGPLDGNWAVQNDVHADVTLGNFVVSKTVVEVPTEELKFWIGEGSDASAEGSNGIGYTVDPKDTAAKEVNITYTGKDQDFKTIGSWVKELFAEKDTFVFDITNNDTEHNVKVRFDVKDAAGVINVVVTAENGTVSQNGTENYVEVETGETATVTVKFEGAVQELIMFVGCCGPLDGNWAVQNDVHADVTLGNFVVSKTAE